MSHILKNPKIPAILVIAAILALLGYGGWAISKKRSSGPPERKIAFYQDSMHPWIKSDQPGKCTICSMDLTPIYVGDQGFGVGDNMVVLSPNSITVVNVKTDEVKRQPLCRTLRVAGTLEIDESRKVIVSAPAASRIETMNVPSSGIEVQKGYTLLTLFSPDLVQRGRYYRAAIASQGGTDGDKMPWSVGENPYSSACVSSISGTVTERLVSTGQYVTDGEKLLTIVDASVLWFRFDVYEQQLPWCELGQKIDVVVPAVPGQVFRAVIGLIEPTVNDATRTVKMRADIQNPMVTIKGRPQRLLRFGMYAEGCVKSDSPGVVAVPRTAILSPGSSAYAYVDKGSGAYELRQVKLGRQGDECWEVLQGLEEGDRVVTSGNVLIDAQAQFSHGNKLDSPITDEIGMNGSSSTHEVQDTTDTTHDASAAHCQVHTESQPADKKVDSAGAREARDTTVTTQTITMGEHEPAPAAPNQTPSPGEQDPRLIISADHRRAFRNFVNVAGYISQALAADDLKQYNWHMAQLPSVLVPLQEWTVSPQWEGPMKRLYAFAVKPQPAPDLATARQQFLAFSTITVELSKQLRKEASTFADVKIYHCPMAPKPGLWMQTEGPLRNPFYGAEMLTCGSEVKP